MDVSEVRGGDYCGICALPVRQTFFLFPSVGPICRPCPWSGLVLSPKNAKCPKCEYAMALPAPAEQKPVHFFLLHPPASYSPPPSIPLRHPPLLFTIHYHNHTHHRNPPSSLTDLPPTLPPTPAWPGDASGFSDVSLLSSLLHREGAKSAELDSHTLFFPKYNPPKRAHPEAAHYPLQFPSHPTPNTISPLRRGTH